MKIVVNKWPGVDSYCIWIDKVLKKCFHGKDARKRADDYAAKIERAYKDRGKRSNMEKYSGLEDGTPELQIVDGTNAEKRLAEKSLGIKRDELAESLKKQYKNVIIEADEWRPLADYILELVALGIRKSVMNVMK